MAGVVLNSSLGWLTAVVVLIDPTFRLMLEAFRLDCIRLYGPALIRNRIPISSPSLQSDRYTSIHQTSLSINDEHISPSSDLSRSEKRPPPPPAKPSAAWPKIKWYYDRVAEAFVCRILTKESDFAISSHMNRSHIQSQAKKDNEKIAEAL